jgi:hypothetical protein
VNNRTTQPVARRLRAARVHGIDALEDRDFLSQRVLCSFHMTGCIAVECICPNDRYSRVCGEGLLQCRSSVRSLFSRHIASKCHATPRLPARTRVLWLRLIF